jgi:cation:H+ antiporter
MLSELKSIGAISAKAKALSAIWTFPSIILSALVIGWAAEAAQFLLSQGLALAILAWLQTLPEFAVEAVIAWEAGIDPEKVHLITANFTGSLRLLVGLAWPMIYFTAAFFRKKRPKSKRLVNIKLEGEHAVEVMGLLPPISYFVIIVLKGTLTLYDSAVLFLMYVSYLYFLRKIPPQDQEKIEDAEKIPRLILKLKPIPRGLSITALFLIGGFWLYFVAHPFLYSMLALATLLGVSNFVFVQWVAPFLSEFPEKVTAFNWARTVRKAPMGLMNMVSSNINQWTVLVAMIPIVYSFSRGEISVVHFDAHQKMEIFLTMAQSTLGFVLLANMEFRWHEALGLFVLWFTQFIFPGWREEITFVYIAWIVIELGLVGLGKKRLEAFREFKLLAQRYVFKSIQPHH